jgi:transposase
MPRLIKLVPHLSLAEMAARQASASDAVTRTHWRLLYWVAGGTKVARVARLTGYSAKWIGQLARRYNEQGPAAVEDLRHYNRGAPPLLSPEQCVALTAALEGSAPDGGLWSGPKVAAWMSAALGRPVRSQRGWDYLRRCGFTPHRPRPRHAQADAAAQAAFPKASRISSTPSSRPSRRPASNSGRKMSTGSG